MAAERNTAIFVPLEEGLPEYYINVIETQLPTAEPKQLNATYIQIEALIDQLRQKPNYQENPNYLALQVRKADVFQAYWQHRRKAVKLGDPKKRDDKPSITRVTFKAEVFKAKVDKGAEEFQKKEVAKRSNRAKKVFCNNWPAKLQEVYVI